MRGLERTGVSIREDLSTVKSSVYLSSSFFLQSLSLSVCLSALPPISLAHVLFRQVKGARYPIKFYQIKIFDKWGGIAVGGAGKQ